MGKRIRSGRECMGWLAKNRTALLSFYQDTGRPGQKAARCYLGSGSADPARTVYNCSELAKKKKKTYLKLV